MTGAQLSNILLASWTQRCGIWDIHLIAYSPFFLSVFFLCKTMEYSQLELSGHLLYKMLLPSKWDLDLVMEIGEVIEYRQSVLKKHLGLQGHYLLTKPYYYFLLLEADSSGFSLLWSIHMQQSHREGLLKYNVSDSVGAEWSLRNCVPDMLPGAANAAGLGPNFERACPRAKILCLNGKKAKSLQSCSRHFPRSKRHQLDSGHQTLLLSKILMEKHTHRERNQIGQNTIFLPTVWDSLVKRTGDHSRDQNPTLEVFLPLPEWKRAACT